MWTTAENLSAVHDT